MTLNQNVIEYMKGINVTDVVDRKISSLILLYENFLPEPIQDIFIEYYYKSKEDYAYPSVQMYSENYLYQIENFLTNDDLDIFPMLGIDYLTVSPEKYDFGSDWLADWWIERVGYLRAHRKGFKIVRGRFEEARP